MNNAVIYARYSSHTQNEQSIETQVLCCQEYALRNNLNIIATYEDRAKSGTNNDRDGFQKMLADSSKKTFKYVIIYNLSRFSRNNDDGVIDEKELKKNGVSVISATENINGDDNDPVACLMKNIMRGINEYYSKNTAKNIRDGLRTNARKGLSIGGFSLPLGFKSNSDREILIDKDETEIVRKIFDMFDTGSNYAEIIRYMNLHNIKTKRGNNFNKSSIKRLLMNKKYVGKYIFKGEEMPTKLPQIINDDLFYRVQEKINNRKKSPGRARTKTDYILSGKLYCGNCNENMVGQSCTSKTKRKYYYYICKNRIAKVCNKERVSKDLIEDFVFSKTRNILTDENINLIANQLYNHINNENNDYELKSLQKTLKNIEKEKKNLLNSLKLADNDTITKIILEELSQNEKQLNEIKIAILTEEAKQLKVSISQIKFFLRGLRKGNVNDLKYRKMLIDTFISKVYLYEDNKIMFIFTINSDKFEGKIPSQDELLSSLKGTNAPPLGNLFELFELLI